MPRELIEEPPIRAPLFGVPLTDKRMPRKEVRPLWHVHFRLPDFPPCQEANRMRGLGKAPLFGHCRPLVKVPIHLGKTRTTKTKTWALAQARG